MGKRKILTGRTIPGNPGLPEKCPTISLDDAGVTEDGGAEVTVRSREQYFMFDREIYRAWSNGAFWLDDDPDIGSNGSRLQQVCSNCCKQENDWNEEETGKNAPDPDINRSMYVHVQQNKRTESTDNEPPGDGPGASVLRTAANKTVKCAFKSKNMDPEPNLTALIGSTCCKRAANAANINPPTPSPHRVAKDEPGPASAADVVGQTGRREAVECAGLLLRKPRDQFRYPLRRR